jgi:hypothetical protein
MSTLTVSPASSVSSAHTWFEEHYAELHSRARVFARRLPHGQREDAVSEILAQVWRYTLSAAVRNKLSQLTPFTLVQFFGRNFAAGHGLGGTRRTDVLSAAVRHQHGVRVVSLDEPRLVRTPQRTAYLPLSEVLADGRAELPPEACRKNLDYPGILKRRKASRKGRQVFTALAQSHGTVRGVDLARELHVSAPRIVQLKRQLARCLAVEDYGPPPTRHAGPAPMKRGRRFAPALNAGSSPPACSS